MLKQTMMVASHFLRKHSNGKPEKEYMKEKSPKV
jgi:hypothetical protein